MAKYQKYAEYKDSGVEWLGDIPSHWETCSISKLFAIKAGGDVDLKNFSEDRSEEYPYPIYTNANDENSIYGYSKVANYQANSITVSGRGEVGFSVYRDHPFEAIIRLLVLTPQKKCYPKFYAYYINEVINFRVESSAIGQLSTLQISPYKTVLPSIDEQKLISNYLDHETAKIDSLITKQEKLIELLKEKRQAVISHAVTKGLNPDVAMKDSGVEWLGEVPAHWEVSRVGWLCEFISYGFTNPMPSTDEGPYMLTATDIEFGRVKYEGARRTSIEAFRNLLSPKSKPQAGDILVTKDGTLGRTALFDGDNEVCISQSVALLRLQKKIVLPEFLVRAFSGADYQSKIIFDAGGTTIKHIYISTLSKMNFVLPPMHEQKTIVDELKSKLADMDQLIDQAINASNLLGERRTALISSAVTGKIDVRNWQHPNEAKTELSL